MSRTTFGMFRQSRAPQSLGNCARDIPGLAALVNEATEQAVKAGGETGFWGCWQKMAFAVDPADPYITLPRDVARLINIAVCKFPIRIQNSFFEYLEAGIGVQPTTCNSECQFLETYDRGTFPTFRDLDVTGNPKVIRLYPTDQRDVGRRVFIQGKDSNGTVLRSLDNGVDVPGIYVTLETPFTDTEFQFGEDSGDHPITGVQKDLTVSDVRMYEVDVETGEMVLLSLLQPSELVSCYRRYFLNGLPNSCCQADEEQDTVAVTALAKLEFVPVAVDQDYLMIGNIPALKALCESVRYGEIDNPQALAMSKVKWDKGIKMLNQELQHYLGRQNPALHFAPFRTATLRRAGVGYVV